MSANLTIRDDVCEANTAPLPVFKIEGVALDPPDPAPPTPRQHASSKNLDITSIYLREIGHTPLLSRQEEHELALRVATGDRDAKAALIKANLRLVVHIAKRFRNRTLSLLDLIQEGNLGLIRAIEKFDPHAGTKLSTYATWWIRQSISRAIQDKSRTIRLPSHIHEVRSKLKRASANGALPDDPDLINAIPQHLLGKCKVKTALEAPTNLASLDTPLPDEDGSVLDLLATEGEHSPEQEALREEMQRALAETLGGLKQREQEILKLRFGLEGHARMTLAEIATGYDLTRERIRQIEIKALEKLRHPDRIWKLQQLRQMLR